MFLTVLRLAEGATGKHSVRLLRVLVWYGLHSLLGESELASSGNRHSEEAVIQGREPVHQGILDSHIKMRENSRYLGWSGWESCRRVW